jgi:ribosomal protein S18 acetylase RimI-like enzyme
VSVEVQYRREEPGDVRHLQAAWTLKERIRREENVLRQDRSFFTDCYRRCYDYLCLDRDGTTLHAFAVVRADGYLSLLGVHPDVRRRGLGSQLLAQVTGDFDRVTCHTRVGNDAAVSFYLRNEFVVADLVPNYYRDGADAYELVWTAEGAADVDRLAARFESH